MNSAQRLLVGRIFDWSERGFVENQSTASMPGMVVGGGVGGAYTAFSDFEAAAIQLARSLVTQEAAELSRYRASLSRMLPEPAVHDASLLEIPGFLEHEKGPALTFMPAMEDRARKLFVQFRVDGEWSLIKLEPGEVRQARVFLDAWLRLAEGERVEVKLEPEPDGAVLVYDRKYRFYRKPGDYRVHVDRHGERWLTIEQGCNAIAALMDELIEAREWLVEWKNANTALASRLAAAEIAKKEHVETLPGGLKKLRMSSAYGKLLQGPAELETVLDGLRDELDRARRFGATLFNWAHEHGEVLDPKGAADTYGDGVRASKGQVRAILERHAVGEYDEVSEERFVQMLDERVAEFRRLYANESLEAFLAWCRARVSPAVRVAFEVAVEPRLREPAKPAPAPLDTTNRFMVTAHDGEVLMRKPIAFRVFTATEALQLASWLIAGAELADYDRPLETVIATVKAIRVT